MKKITASKVSGRVCRAIQDMILSRGLQDCVTIISCPGEFNGAGYSGKPHSMFWLVKMRTHQNNDVVAGVRVVSPWEISTSCGGKTYTFANEGENHKRGKDNRPDGNLGNAQSEMIKIFDGHFDCLFA